MAKLPWFKFYPGDWMKDPNLRRCSLAARGILTDIMCLMFEATPRGVLQNCDGSPWSNADISRACGSDTRSTSKAISELESKGVLSRNDRKCLYSRRLMRDEQTRQARAVAGSKGGSKTQNKAKQNSSKTVTYEHDSDSSSPDEEKDSTNFQADLRALDNLIGLWKPEKRGGRILARRRLADALGRLAGAEGSKEPWQRLAAQMRAYTASDQGRSMYCKSLSGWLEEGGYLQNPREWANDSNQKGSGTPLKRSEIETKLNAARQNLSLVPPEADGDGDRAKLKRVVEIWEKRLAEHQGDNQ